MLPEEDFGKILAKSSNGDVDWPQGYEIHQEGVKLILCALYGAKSLQKASIS